MEFEKYLEAVKNLPQVSRIKERMRNKNASYEDRILERKYLTFILSPILKYYFGIFYCEKNGFNKDGYFRRLNKLQLKDFEKTVLRLSKEGNPVYYPNCEPVKYATIRIIYYEFS